MIYNLVKRSQPGCPPPSLSVAGKLVATPTETETRAFCDLSYLDSRSLQISSRKKYDSLKFSYIFKKFILIVYDLDDSVCVVHVPKLRRSRSLSPSALQPTLLLCLPLAFTPRCPRSSWMSVSVPHLSSPWTYPAAHAPDWKLPTLINSYSFRKYSYITLYVSHKASTLGTALVYNSIYQVLMIY